MFPYVLIIGAVLAPWVIVKSVAFNARYTAYRNIIFTFMGKYIEAFKILLAWGLTPLILSGLIFNWFGKYWIAIILFALFIILFPWWIKNIKKFVVTKTYYGGHSGNFYAKGGDFFKIYFKAGLIMFLFAISAGVINTINLIGSREMT
jgi:uncharacterized membrane protein YjgN (DUF898 family)